MPPRKPKRSVSAEDVQGLPKEKKAAISSDINDIQAETGKETEASNASKDEVSGTGPTSDPSAPQVNRWAFEDLVRDVVIGYTGDDDEDPPQAGSSSYRHSKDIHQMILDGLDIPVSKDQRSNYVWVAAAKIADNQGAENQEIRKKKYTWNPEEIQPLDASIAESKQIRCDICGALCTEVLYEFRCYKRTHPDETRPPEGRRLRRLHPFVSFISKECGQSLLGLPSGASRLRERVYRLLTDADGLAAVEELEEVWRLGNDTMRQILTDELRFLSRTEAGVPRRAAELRKAEAIHGELHKEKEDVFRAVARATGPVLNARDLASVTINYAEEQDEENLAQPSAKGTDAVQQTNGFLGQVAEALRERKPLPAVPAQWSRADVVNCLQALVNAWHPLRIELHDSLHGPQVFQFHESHKQKKRKKDKEIGSGPLISLIYLPGCQELHSINSQSCKREDAQALKDEREDVLKQCREDYTPLEILHGGQGRYSRAEDKAIDIPQKVSFEHIWNALNQITWPNCFTRNNVRPDGAPFIEAFPLGVVLNYALGLVCSRPTRLWPNLTKLLAKFIAQEQPDFRYTTVQLNKNYATKMHVDGNNHGPSYIIGLGDYTGGEVWILDEENGTVEVELPCAMRGWPHLRPGTKVKGRLEDCHNKWLKFDGNTPHMTMPYTGSRISIVFFTRRGWLTMLPETKESLDDSGFLLPGEEFLELSTVKQEVKEEPDVKEKRVARAPRMQEVKEEPMGEDEVDEDEEVDQEMRAEQDAATWPSHDWGARLRTYFNDFTGFRESNLNVALLGSANVFGIALQELLSRNSFRITTCTVAGGVAMRLMKRTCKPQHAFLNLDAALAGHGHCDIHHKVCTVCTSGSQNGGSEKETQDLLFGSFACEPFLNQDPSRPSCFDDPRSGVFCSLRKQVATQKPRAALLLVECWQKIPQVSQASVRHFLLDGKDPRLMESEEEEAFWGLRHLDDYAATFLEVPLEACGVPLAGDEAMILLVRKDCGGVSAAEAASQLVRTMLNSNLLPRCSLHALMFSGEDPRVVQAQKESREAAQKGKSRRRPPNGAMRKKVANEIRDLGLQPGEVPYTDHLRRQRLEASRLGQGQFPPDQWLRQAPDEKAVQVNLLFARAGQDGLDIENLCADLSQGFAGQGQRDDGLLPRSTVIKMDMDNMSEFYSFNRNQHRTLVGQELLLCFGYPIWRLDFRGISDAEATQLTARSAAIPAVGVCIAAMLAVVKLPGRKTLPECLGRKDIAHLLSKVEVKEEKPDVASETKVQAVQSVQAPVADPGVEVAVDEDGVRLESKAAALLNLVSHGAFASRPDSMPSPSKKREAAKGIFSALSDVAKSTQGEDQDEEKGGTKRKELEQDGNDMLALIEEPLDWQVRLRKLNFASTALEPMSLETVLKWITEAAEDPEAELSPNLIRNGVAEFRRRVSKDEPVPEALYRSRQSVINTLKDSGFADFAEEVDVAMRASQLGKHLTRGVKQACLDGQTKDSIDHYVKTVVRGCDRRGWMMRRLFINHLSHIAARSVTAGDQAGADRAQQSLTDFGNAGGWPYIISWLKETPDPNTWPSGEALDQLGSCLPARTPVELFVALYVVLTSTKLAYAAKSLLRIERIVAKAMSPFFDRNVEQALPQFKEMAASGGAITARFEVVLELMNLALELQETTNNPSGQQSQTWRHFQQKIQLLAVTKTSKSWQHLAALEADFVEELKQAVEQNLKLAMEHEEEVRQKQQVLQQGQAQEHLEQCRQSLLAVVSEDGHLKEKTQAGLKRCLAKMKNLHEAMQKVEVPSPFCSEAWNLGRAAVQQFSETRLRCSKAFKWLQDKQLGFCARLLDTCDLLEQLHLIRESPQKLETVGLPYRCEQLLLAAAEKDALSKNTFGPKLEEVPQGWEQNTSRHLNLQYFQKEGGQMQWERPLPKNLVAWRNDAALDSSTSEMWQRREEDHALVEAKKMTSSESNLDGCPYKEGDRCLLCDQDFDDKHTSSSRHGQQIKHWKQITDRMAMVCLDMQKLPQDETCQPGLASAWRGELWQALKVPPVPPNTVLGPFWHRVVLPRLSSSSSKSDRDTAAGLQTLLMDGLKVARAWEGQEAKISDKEISAAIVSLEKKMQGLTNISITPAVAALKELRIAVISSSIYTGTRSPLLDSALNTLQQAEAAIQHFCSEPAFHAVVQNWMQQHRLESCFSVLSHRGVLALLSKGKAAEVDATYGLPTHISERLSEAWHSEGALRRLRARRSPPEGYEMVFSRSVGLFYYCQKVMNGRAQWPYPITLQNDAARGILPAVPNSLEDWTRGKPLTGSVPYVEMNSKGEPMCLLCKVQGLEHFASAGHVENVSIWSSIQNRLSALEHDLGVQSSLLTSQRSSTSSVEMAALAKVWLHEIQQNTLVPEDSSDARKQVSYTFWHLLLGPWSSQATPLVKVQQELDRGLTLAGLPEPQWSTLEWQARQAPQPDVDFPRPRVSTLKLPPFAPAEVFDALSAQALRSEGINAQADGTLWCVYCDKPVKELSVHLDRTCAEAQEHMENRVTVKMVVTRLKDEGYQLRCEGLMISKRRFQCGLCNISGNWKWTLDHRSTPSHRDAYANLLKSSVPAARQVEINNQKFKEAELESWKAAFAEL